MTGFRNTAWKLIVLSMIVSLTLVTAGCTAPAAPTAAPTNPPAAQPAAATKAPAPTTAPAPTVAPTAAPTAAPKPTEAPKPAAKKVLTVAAANQYGETLDIFNTATTMQAHNMIYENLVYVDKDYKYQPGLAESWETSKDGLTWTFHLKKGVKFHDGSDFNSEVVKWWIEGMKTGVNSYMFETVKEIQTPDPNTIILILPDPFPNMLYNLSTSFSGVMSKVAYEKYGKEYGTKYAVGTGPFILKEWVPNDHLILDKNPDYNWAPAWTGHKGPANVDQIVWRIIAEDATRVIELQAGNVQLLIDPPGAREQQQFKNNPDYFYLSASGDEIQFVGMNVNDPLLKDIRTRHAIGWAIDRDLIWETIYQKAGRPSNIYLAAELGGSAGVADMAPKFDVAKAKSLLAEAGWKAGSDGILVADAVAGVDKGTKFQVSMWTYQQDEYKTLAEAVQKMLSNVGIKAEVQLMDSPTYSASLKKGGEQLILRIYSWDNNDILEWFHHGKNLPYPNYLGTNDKEFDAMLDEANYKTATAEERDVKYGKLQQYLVDKWYPWAPIRQTNSVFIGRTTVKNFEPIPLRGTSSTVIWTAVDLASK